MVALQPGVHLLGYSSCFFCSNYSTGQLVRLCFSLALVVLSLYMVRVHQVRPKKGLTMSTHVLELAVKCWYLLKSKFALLKFNTLTNIATQKFGDV